MTEACRVLLEDPGLAQALAPARLAEAQRACVAATVVVDAGPWEPACVGERVRGGFGLLIVDGLIVRRVGAQGRFGAELLGPGDLLRPWENDGEDAALPFQTGFRVLHRTRLALLDLRFAGRLAPYPEVATALAGRAMQRARALAVTLAVAHRARVDERLLGLLWHLADRWGRVTPQGIRLPLDLTHQTLADLVVARRQAVTTGLGRLVREGRLSREGNAWVLHGEPPPALDD